MDSGKQRKTVIFRSLRVGILALLPLWFLCSSRPGIAADVRIVKGIVGTAAGNLIFINGKSVNLSGIPVRNSSGKELSFEDITPGKKVGLCYRGGRIFSVLVYEPMVE